jgi:hypothetical protein
MHPPLRSRFSGETYPAFATSWPAFMSLNSVPKPLYAFFEIDASAGACCILHEIHTGTLQTRSSHLFLQDPQGPGEVRALAVLDGFHRQLSQSRRPSRGRQRSCNEQLPNPLRHRSHVERFKKAKGLNSHFEENCNCTRMYGPDDPVPKSY